MVGVWNLIGHPQMTEFYLVVGVMITKEFIQYKAMALTLHELKLVKLEEFPQNGRRPEKK
jgi:hypothetical protein